MNLIFEVSIADREHKRREDRGLAAGDSLERLGQARENGVCHHDRVAARLSAAHRAPVIEKYTGVIAAADVFTESTTFQVMQSIRLDLGYGSKVNP